MILVGIIQVVGFHIRSISAMRMLKGCRRKTKEVNQADFSVMEGFEFVKGSVREKG